jgi:hypothetical protein
MDRELTGCFREDVAKLGGILGRDLGSWLEGERIPAG